MAKVIKGVVRATNNKGASKVILWYDTDYADKFEELIRRGERSQVSYHSQQGLITTSYWDLLMFQGQGKLTAKTLLWALDGASIDSPLPPGSIEFALWIVQLIKLQLDFEDCSFEEKLEIVKGYKTLHHEVTLPSLSVPA